MLLLKSCLESVKPIVVALGTPKSALLLGIKEVSIKHFRQVFLRNELFSYQIHHYIQVLENSIIGKLYISITSDVAFTVPINRYDRHFSGIHFKVYRGRCRLSKVCTRHAPSAMLCHKIRGLRNA